MESTRTLSLAVWWGVQIVCVIGILWIFSKLRKKLEQKYLLIVGIVAAAFFSITSVRGMVQLQIQIFGMREAAKSYRSSISDDMDGKLIEAIRTHNSNVDKLQARVQENPVIYWLMCGDYGEYEVYKVDIPDQTQNKV